MASAASRHQANNFELDLSDGENISDSRSVASFGDDATPMEDNLGLDEFQPDINYDQAEIIFAQDDTLPLSDPLNETGFDEDDLQGYDDAHAATSPFEYRNWHGHNSVDDPDAEYVPDSDENDAAPITKRARTAVAAPLKSAQPAHFHVTTQAAARSAKRTTIENSRTYDIDDEASVAYKAPSRKAGTFGRHNREKGSTLPAYHKKVTHDLDSDDELMIAMRDRGYSDKQISERLKKENRIRYDAKSISTRIQRIRVIQAERSEFELENGIKEWKLEEDFLLLRAYDLAEIEIAYEIERLRAWRWKKTAEWMRRMSKGTIFSGKACHKRYIALMDGTATIPCDVDDNPDERKADLERFRQEREENREKEREEKEAQEAKHQRIREEAAVRSSKKAVETAQKNHARYVAEEARATERATKKALRAQQANDNVRKKTELAQAKQKAKDAKEAERKFRQEFALKNFKHVTKDSPDPRSVLDISDLKMLCRRRKLNDHTPRTKGDTTKQELLKRLRNADEGMSHNDLVNLCKHHKIPLGGTKVQMAYQLALCAARACDSFVPDENGAQGGDEGEADSGSDRIEL